MKLISIDVNPKERKDIKLPHYINPLKYYQKNENKSDQAKKLSAFFIDTIPFLSAQQRKESKTEIEDCCIELFEKIDSGDIWSVCFGLESLESILNSVIKKSEKQLIAFISQNNNITQDVMEVTKLIDKTSPFLSEKEKQQLLEKYAHIKVKQLICSGAYEETCLQQLPKRVDDKKMSQEDRAIKSHAKRLIIEEELVSFFHMMCTLFLGSQSAKKQFMTDIKNQFAIFCKAINEHATIKINFTQSALEKKFNQFIENHFSYFMTVMSKRIDINQQEKLLALKAQRKKLLATSDKTEKQLLTEMIECEKTIVVKNKALLEANSHINTQMIKLFTSITHSANEEKFLSVAKMLGLSEITFDNGDCEQDISGIINSWFTSITTTICAYLPSREKVELGIKVIEYGTIGAALGVNGALAGVGLVLAQNKIQKATVGYSQRKTGKLNAKYKSNNFEVNENLIFAFDTKEKAEMVNNWYVARLYEIDIKLENMSAMEQKESGPLELQRLYSDLHANYQKMKNGDLNKLEARTAFKKDLATILKRLHRAELKNTAQYLQTVWQLCVKNSQLTTVPQSVSVEEVADETLSGANQMAPFKETNPLVARKTESMALTTAKDKKALELTHRTIHSKKVSVQVHAQLSESERIGSLLNLEDNQLASWRTEESLTIQYREATKLPFNATFEQRVEEFVDKGSMDSLLIWFKENFFIEMYSEHQEIRFQTVGKKLEKCQNKTLWHILCDEPQGLKLFQKIMILQKQATSSIENHVGLAWKFIHYFSPNVKYDDMNPIEYAFKQGNVMILMEYLTHLVECEHVINNQEEIFAFMLVKDKHAITFCKALQDEIHERLRQGQSSFARLAGAISSQFQPTSNMLRIMSALTIRLAQGMTVPLAQQDIVAFVKELKEEKSVYITLPALSKFTNMHIETIAKKISDKFKQQHTVANQALIQTILSLNALADDKTTLEIPENSPSYVVGLERETHQGVVASIAKISCASQVKHSQKPHSPVL